MKTKHFLPKKWTAAERARHKAIRKEFANSPSQDELEGSGNYEGPIKSGAYFLVRVLIHDLKKSRQAAALTLAAVSDRTGIDQATLSRLENGRQPNPTIDTLWRYANAVGRRLVLTHENGQGHDRRNGKLARNAPK